MDSSTPDFNETDLQKLWDQLGFNLDDQTRRMLFQYPRLGNHFVKSSPDKDSVYRFVQSVFFQFMIARFGKMYPQQDQDLITRSDRTVKEEYNRLFMGVINRKSDINDLMVACTVLVHGLVKRVFPSVEYNKRLTMEIMHLVLFSTLGMPVGDNSVKYLIGKAFGHAQITRFLFRKMFYEKILQANIKQVQEQKEWPELKKIFYKAPLNPPKKVPFDQGYQTQKPRHDFVRSLGKYSLVTTQMSRALVSQDTSFHLKQSSLKKFNSKANVSLQCGSPFYRPTKKPETPGFQNIDKQESIKSIGVRKGLQQWQGYLLEMKNIPDSFTEKEKFLPIQACLNSNSKGNRLRMSVQLPCLNKSQKKSDSMYNNDLPKLQIQNRQAAKSSVYQKKPEPTVLETNISKHPRKCYQSKVTRLKAENREFKQNLLKNSNEYEQALSLEFRKLSLIR